MRDVDMAIVGAGPTGLFAAYYAGFRGLSVVLVDALPEPGGQVTAMYPEKMIFDVAGFPAIRGRDLVTNLVEQAAQFNPGYLLGVRADPGRVRGDACGDRQQDGVLHPPAAARPARRPKKVPSPRDVPLM